MTNLSCSAARRRLQAFHDGELQAVDQTDVRSHVEWCDDCAAELAGLRLLREHFRSVTLGRTVLSDEEGAALQATVIGRLEAEDRMSLATGVREFFDDKYLVYARLTALAAALACVVSLFGIMRFAATVQPDSLAALMNAVPPLGSNENPVPVDGYVLMPRALDQAFSTAMNVEDAEFTLMAVVTREGTVSNLELRSGTHPKGVEDLMGAISQARFEPARVDGLPVAVNMVWLVTNTTVHASDNEPPLVRRGSTGIKKGVA